MSKYIRETGKLCLPSISVKLISVSLRGKIMAIAEEGNVTLKGIGERLGANQQEYTKKFFNSSNGSAGKTEPNPLRGLVRFYVFINRLFWARMLLIPTKGHPRNRRQGICSEPLSNLMCSRS
jgi:hypothetical protein